ncbi:P-loop domain-containing protein [Staphylococcus saprophyticus]|uniref:P-loop domain-containing protein n=1 Tax=Staphylococcus saprophyticus TaxID=29385 RepID=UPI002DB7A0C0|nr:P-loop domain-containing protein [Staphylococcus saprophyticus]
MIDQVFIREALSRQNLVAFVANGSILPRRSGVSDMPLAGAVTFQSPQEFEMVLLQS